MAKLYPPGLEGSLPAFYSQDSAIRISIPFSQNKTVAQANVSGMSLMIKTVSTNKILGTVQTKAAAIDFTNNIVEFDLENDDVAINLEKEDLIPEQFYKVQLAYISPASGYEQIRKSDINFRSDYSYYYYSLDKYLEIKDQDALNKLKDKEVDYYRSVSETIGYYSTVGVIKYTKTPVINILNLNVDSINTNSVDFIGEYTNEDSTEKVYSYRFDVYTENNDLYESSGDLIHNHYGDLNENKTTDSFTMIKQLKQEEIYYIKYSVKTINGLVISSSYYPIGQLDTIELSAPIALRAEYNEENAYINLYISPSEINKGSTVKGKFIITRSCSKDGYNYWHELTRFVLTEENFIGEQKIFQDFTIEDGYVYQYAIQQYNKYNFFTNRLEPETARVLVHFEHLFLYDGKKQLKIKFNPKVSSIKKTQQETKIDTIGSKYPYIFRNGKIGYKEFPISGLISYQADEEELFSLDEELFMSEYNSYSEGKRLNTPADEIIVPNRTTNLTYKNITAERLFREKVYEFLTDGQPKLFKSPTEGNSIVRLMNSSLTPNTTLGRMLNDFSSTAYEIDDYNYQNLVEYGFVTVKEPLFTFWRWRTVNTADITKYYKIINKEDPTNMVTINFNDPVQSVSIVDAMPGTKYQIGGTEIKIGVTGQYHIDFGDGYIDSLQVLPTMYSGIVTFRYTEDVFDEFDLIKGIKIDKINNVQQFIGKRYISEELNDKTSYITNYKVLNFEKRPEVTLYIKENIKWDDTSETKMKQTIENFSKINTFYIDKKCSVPFNNLLENFYVYKIVKGGGEFEFLPKEQEAICYIDVSQIKKDFIFLGYEYKILLSNDQNFKDYITKEYDGLEFYYRPLGEGAKKSSVDCVWLPLQLDKNGNIRDINNENQLINIQKYYYSPLYQVAVKQPLNRSAYSNGGFEQVIRDWFKNNQNDKILSLDDLYSYTSYKDYYKINQKYAPIVVVSDDKDFSYSYNELKDKKAFQINDKIFISPEEYDNNIFIISLHKNELHTETIELKDSLFYKADDISDIINLEIGWGVIATCVFDIKNIEYSFDSYILPELKQSFENAKKELKTKYNPDTHNKYIKAKIDLINSYLDVIYAYEKGEGVPGDD